MNLNTSKILLSAASLLFLAACTTPTFYEPKNESNSYGYSTSQIETDRWTVRFEGNSLTERETVETYLLYRAAELTLEQGFDYFIAADRQTDEETTYRSSGLDHYSPFYRSLRLSYYHPFYGWSHHRDPFRDDIELREIKKYQASVEIVLRKGSKPSNDINAYSAKDVLSNLAENIVLPPVE